MTIERTEEGILIKTSANVDISVLQKIINYIKIQEITERAQGTEEQAAELAQEVNKRWWSENKHRFIK